MTVQGNVKHIDAVRRQIQLTDGTAVPVEFICSIDGELFDDML